MAPTTFQGYQCWQTQRITQVINKEAVAVNRATFLATHTPFTDLTYVKTPAQIEDTSEVGLLDEVAQRAKAGQHTFTVIQGIPGTGKSHLIRWLYERYTTRAHNQGNNEVILLVERANNSLRQTLTQILESGVFKGEQFAAQKRKLEGATRQLSSEGLEEALLNNLQLAHTEVELAADETPPRFIGKRVEHFLLDKVIREELRRPGGPIKRLARFLSGGEKRRQEDEHPRFLPTDFAFSRDVRGQLRGPSGYQEAKDLANKLERDRYRIELADYFNALLDFTISQTTALAAEDLKQMFNDLRRELRQQNKDLTLFVEDITAFTGLDRGLVDILVTQHTGEGNREFCRLLSVVGVTDDYFESRFPDNVRERITHHLTLNLDDKQDRQQSRLLTHSTAVGDLGARYLNALRVDEAQLEAWRQRGADPQQLPNACATCPHRQPCHAAFGAVTLQGTGNSDGVRVGLYPFNQSALETMYDNLDRTKVSRTPRSFLTSIVHHVLLNHGELVQEGRFPPPRTELGNEFNAPTLSNPLERRKLNRAGLSTAEQDRFESLVVFWGNRTLEQGYTADGEPTIGALAKRVFTAFQLPFIGKDDSRHEPQTRRIIEEINAWRQGGSLQSHKQLTRMLADFVRDRIDWTAHRVADALVDRWIRGETFYIFGQRERAPSTPQLRWQRSEKLADTLIALWELNRRRNEIRPEQRETHLRVRQQWLEDNQAKIIAFVREQEQEEEEGPDDSKEPPVQPQQDPVIEDIQNWLAGEQLHHYAKLAGYLAAFVKEAIDWTAHGVSDALVDERVRQARFAIEDQVGRNTTYYLLFPRSDELAYTLTSLHLLNKSDNLSSASYGAHLTTLSHWLKTIESTIVAFVRDSHRENPSPTPLVTLLAQDTAALACLTGELSQQSHTPRELYQHIIASAKRDRDWQQTLEVARNTRARMWIDLMRRQEIQRNVTKVRKHLLEHLNCRVGRGDIRFLDAATLLEPLEALLSADWSLDDVDMVAHGHVWTPVAETHNSLVAYFQKALAAEQTHVTTLLQRVEKQVGKATIRKVFEEIDGLLHAFQRGAIPYDHERYTAPSESKAFTQARHYLKKITAGPSSSKLAPLLADDLAAVKRAQDLANYLETVTHFCEQKCQEWEKKIEASGGPGVDDSISQVEEEYAATSKQLETIVQEVKSL